MSRLTRRLGALLAATVVSATLTSALPASAGTTADPHYQEPTLGACYDYGWTVFMAESVTRAPVSCAESHREKVIAVAQLPEALTFESDSSSLFRFVTKTCHAGWRTYLGRTESLRHRSAYTWAYFYPTQAQRDQGARWIRCDLVLLSRNSLLPIKRNAIPILPAAPLPKSVARCLYGEDLYLTVCSAPHRFKATGTHFVDRSTYPTRTEWTQIANRRCPGLTNTRVWVARWPLRIDFLNANHKSLVCYSKHSL